MITTTVILNRLFGSDGKESGRNGGDLGLIPGLGISSGEGNGYLLQDFCLENSMDRGGWQATVHGVAKSLTRLSDQHISILVTISLSVNLLLFCK